VKSFLIITIVGLFFWDPFSLRGQVSYEFRNRYGNGIVDAPIFDATGAPLAGTNFMAILYGGRAIESLQVAWDYPAQYPMAPVHFLDGAGAGYFFGGAVIIPQSPPGGFAWLQVRAWDARLGATYDEVAARGLGGYGESSLFYAEGGDPTAVPPDIPRPLIGLQSFSLRPVPEPSVAALLALGGLAAWMRRHCRRWR
jgi:hypothetical protein